MIWPLTKLDSVEVHDRDGGAITRQALRRRGADPTTGAGDQGDTSAQIACHVGVAFLSGARVTGFRAGASGHVSAGRMSGTASRAAATPPHHATDRVASPPR